MTFPRHMPHAPIPMRTSTRTTATWLHTTPTPTTAMVWRLHIRVMTTTTTLTMTTIEVTTMTTIEVATMITASERDGKVVGGVWLRRGGRRCLGGGPCPGAECYGICCNTSTSIFNNWQPYIWFYGRIVYGALWVMAVPSTVPYKMVPLASTVRYGVPYYGTHKPYMYGYGQQP